MKNGWTGGQYSLFRVIFGAYLFGHFVQLIPWGAEVFSNRGVLPQASASPLFHLMPNVLALADSPLAVCVLLVLGAGLSGLLLVGWHDRIAAALLWYVWACLFSRNPLIANPSLPFIGWLLLAHCCLPPAPYGSWAARARGASAPVAVDTDARVAFHSDRIDRLRRLEPRHGDGAPLHVRPSLGEGAANHCDGTPLL